MLSCRFDNLSVSLMVVGSVFTLAYNSFIHETLFRKASYIWEDWRNFIPFIFHLEWVILCQLG